MKNSFTLFDLIRNYCNNGYAIRLKANGLYSVYHPKSGTMIDDVGLADIVDTCNEVRKAYHEQGNKISKEETISIVLKMYEYYLQNAK